MSDALQEEVIRHLQIQGADSELVRTIYVQELNRVKYMMRAYLRCRLLKVEKYVMHVLDNEEEQDKLSPQELHHAQVGRALHSPDIRGNLFSTRMGRKVWQNLIFVARV